MSALTEVTTPSAPRSLTLISLVLRVLLAAFFAFLAVKNLAGDVKMAQDFERFGFPDWFRIVVALMQIAGACLLLVPGLELLGCAVLGFVLAGAIVSHVRHDPLPTVISPVVFLVLLGAVIVLTRRISTRGA